MAETVSLVIPTVSRSTLARTLLSLRGQPWIPGDQVLLVGDGPQPQARELWDQFNLPGRYLETPYRLGHWGHGLRNWVFDTAQARGKWIAALDDDDTWLSSALATIRDAIRTEPSRPHIFKMRDAPIVGTVWNEPEIRHANVGTPMLVCPNDPARLGRYAPLYGGDCDFIRDTCGFYAEGPAWHEDVICWVRPPAPTPLAL